MRNTTVLIIALILIVIISLIFRPTILIPIIGIILIVIILLISKRRKPKEIYSDSAPCTGGNNTAIYSISGARGRHIDVYEEKCVIRVNASVGSFITGNITDGEKTIYYVDCIGVQFKKSGFTIGYLQLETASTMMNNRHSNFFNENTFTFEKYNVSNEKMKEVANYIKQKVDEAKSAKHAPISVPISSADELKKFKELLDSGILTQEEFDAKKKQLLGQ
ncbi:MAG: SHOCT domain-containing protein [Ruminococcaceae bacterium]|nr:SHOCT domain-containing protein [Oscillospiraceae bacterium]